VSNAAPPKAAHPKAGPTKTGPTKAGNAKAGNAEEKASQTVAAIERAADILLYFTKVHSPDLGITDIANNLGIAKAAVHRVLASLRSRELISLDEHTRRYSLGPAALALGLSALSRVDVRKLALPELALLSQQTNETSTLSVRVGSERIYLDQITPSREVVMSVSIGVRYPLHAGASSKAFLAFLNEAEIEQYLSAPLVSVTDSIVINRDELLAELKVIRERGWATSSGERQSGAASVAAPVLNHASVPVAVLSVCGPKDRFSSHSNDCVKFLLESTQRLSKKVGHQG
jgi:IclR family transcriptional regulator, acetate operon repressor